MTQLPTTKPYIYPGLNPSGEVIMVRDGHDQKEVLLVRDRHSDFWQLPGGPVASMGDSTQPWKHGRETVMEAAIRNMQDVTGIYLPPVDLEIQYVGEYNKHGRDPRDTAQAWSNSTVFLIDSSDWPVRKPFGLTAHSEARWMPIKEALQLPMAMDHGEIMTEGLYRFGYCMPSDLQNRLVLDAQEPARPEPLKEIEADDLGPEI